jgi:hypothetical protein
VLKIIFLAGDYPSRMDYRGDVKYQVTCKEAVRRDLITDTGQCGDVPETTRVWQEIARLAEGSRAALAQSGNMAVVSTPMTRRSPLQAQRSEKRWCLSGMASGRLRR